MDQIGPDRGGGIPSREWLITITANFTAEPVADVLRFWLAVLGLKPARVEFSCHNQIFQELMAPGSALASSEPGINFLLIRFEDWARDQDWDLRTNTITATTQEFIATLRAFSHRARRPTLVCLCPPSQRVCCDFELALLLKSLERDVHHAASGLRGVSVISADDVAPLYPVKLIDDAESDRQGQVPFTQDYWVAVGTILMRKARTYLQPPYKVIAVDADNTIWGGVVAETGADQVRVAEEWLEVQQFLHSRRNQGMLLVLLSKNREEDVSAVFARSDMFLRREDFVAWKVNWQPKSENLRALASDLSLGLDSFLFLDDNPLECAEVASHCPSVTVLALPPQPERIPSFLRHVWAFDLPAATSADNRRTEQYRQQAERKQFQASLGSFREFIARLELLVDFLVPEAETFERAAQLTQRTNQFNATGVRRTASELATLLRSGEREAFLVRVKDRFGDYGEVGLCVYSLLDGELLVENFVLSCRTLGKGVEHRMLAALGRVAGDLGKRHVVIPFRRTKRNEPVAKFLETVGSAFLHDDLYSFPAAAAATVVFDPENACARVVGADDEPAVKAGNVAAGIDFGEIAGNLANVTDIRLAIRRQNAKGRPKLAQPFVAPCNPVEQMLAGIWGEVLGLDGVGIHDDFFDLGGDSVQSIQIISKANQTGLRFTLRQHFQHSTIAELARVIGNSNVVLAKAGQHVVNDKASDFPLAKLGQKSLEQVLIRMGKK